MIRGAGASRKARQKIDDNRSERDARYVPRFSLEDGESVEGIWFNPELDEDGNIKTVENDDVLEFAEPIAFEEHVLSRNNKFDNFPCSLQPPTSRPCVGCEYKNENPSKKDLSGAKLVGAINVADPRFTHKIKNEERSRGEYARYDYKRCAKTDDDPEAPCKLCRKYGKPERGGQKIWKMTSRLHGALLQQTAEIEKTCAKCGKRGKMRKGACVVCGKKVPRNIFQIPWKAIRSGTSTNTTYMLTPDESWKGPRPNWIAKLKPHDLEAYCKPRSDAEVAKLLGIDNPFDEDAPKRSKKRTVGYDDDEEDDDDEYAGAFGKAKKKVVDDDEDDDAPRPKAKKRVVEDDEDDEDEAPVRKAKKRPVDEDEDDEDDAPVPKGKRKAPVDDDDDDDEDDDDEVPLKKRKVTVVDDDEDDEPAPKKPKKKVVDEDDEDEDEEEEDDEDEDEDDEEPAPRRTKKPSILDKLRAKRGASRR